MSTIRVTVEDARGEIPTALIAELSAELKALYPTTHGGDGSGAFKPTDVIGERAGFVVAWDGEDAVGCGALRPMDDSSVAEVKRMFVRPAVRGKGISKEILVALENLARDYGYRATCLETGLRQKEAMGLYESSGYQRIPCYGIYVNEPLSVCYEKVL
jgi:putative acetyltransferase